MTETPTKVVFDSGPIIHLDELNCLDLLDEFPEILLIRKNNWRNRKSVSTLNFTAWEPSDATIADFECSDQIKEILKAVPEETRAGIEIAGSQEYAPDDYRLCRPRSSNKISP